MADYVGWKPALIAALGKVGETLSGLVPKTTTVNGKALSYNVTLTPADVSAAPAATAVTTNTTKTITGAKTMTAPTMVAAVPAATFGADLTPAGGLGDAGWTLAGGATWAAPNLTIPSGGSLSCTIPVTSGRTYQVDVTRSISSGGDMTVGAGGASISVPSWSTNRVTVVAVETGSLTLTVGGGTWVATVQSVVCREVTATAGPALGYGSGQIRQSGSSNNALGYLAQRSLTTGSSNNALGHAAQSSLTTGSSNNALGQEAQSSLTTGSSNNALGHAAQRSLTTGSSNNALGHAAQYKPRDNAAWATTTALRQTSVGHESGQGSANQSDDIVTIGYRAIADGAKAMALGSMASAAHAGSVALGADVTTTALAQVAIGARDLEVQDATKGLVLKSPDGSRWRVTISNLGAATWTKL